MDFNKFLISDTTQAIESMFPYYCRKSRIKILIKENICEVSHVIIQI